MNKFKKTLSIVLAAGLVFSTTAVAASADEPYVSYNYDAWNDAIPSQSGYRVDEVVAGSSMGLDRLSDPDDELFLSEAASDSLSGASDIYYESELDEFWVADTGNNRILRLDADLNIIGAYDTVSGSDTENFSSPTGLYVTVTDDGLPLVYIADTSNARVVRAIAETATLLTVDQEFVKTEDSALYTSSTFNPTKVLADGSGNVYAVESSVTQGAVEFASDGEFKGFYGANRVEVTAAVVAQRVWRMFASNEQLASMERNVNVEFANFDIDSEGFIYTVTEAANTSTDAVKKLNPAGYNIWDTTTGNEYKFGDLVDFTTAEVDESFETRLTDLVISDNMNINVLDYESGRIFQYDQENNLLFVFGSKNSTSDQEGTFTAPNAIESRGEKIYVIDGKKNDITVFTETQFGKMVHEAADLYTEGKYEEAQEPWEEVLSRDGGYWMAYMGLGKAALNEGNYEEAMDYFEYAEDNENYDKAYQYYREEFLSRHFTAIIVILLIIIVAIVVWRIIARRKKPKKKGGK
ncbi:MAG: hypothetical protein LUH57_04620 [Ruminococcus sp.]|nr:hypothetical protein [Ruminococcus sp.]